MIIDIKYHIASLAAVFLALAIGILIGMTMLGNDAILEQQERVTSKLEQDLNILREEAKETQATLADYENTINTYEQFSTEVLPHLIAGRLEGLQVAVIETSNYTFSEELVNTLNSSGAEVNSVTSMQNPVQLTEEASQEIKTFLGLQEEISEEKLQETISQVLALSIKNGKNFEFLTLLEDLELVSLSGDYSIPTNSIILLGGSQERENVQLSQIDIPMIKALLEAEASLYGVENSDVELSYMKEYQKYKITTIDNIDHVIGQLALVWAMENNPGNYGFKETAKSILPQTQKVNQ